MKDYTKAFLVGISIMVTIVLGFGTLNAETEIREENYSTEVDCKSPGLNGAIAYNFKDSKRFLIASSEAYRLCSQAISMAGGDSGYIAGYCGGDSHSASYWRCIIRAMNESGKRGYSNDDVSDVMSFIIGYSSCSN